MTRKIFLSLSLLVLTPTVEVWAQSPAVLKHNPFNQPVFLVEQSALDSERKSLNWRGSLQATLVSGSSSLANVDGNLIGIGEIYKGYELLSVGEGTATFVKDGVKTVVKVDSDGDDDEG